MQIASCCKSYDDVFSPENVITPRFIQEILSLLPQYDRIELPRIFKKIYSHDSSVTTDEIKMIEDVIENGDFEMTAKKVLSSTDFSTFIKNPKELAEFIDYSNLKIELKKRITTLKILKIISEGEKSGLKTQPTTYRHKDGINYCLSHIPTIEDGVPSIKESYLRIHQSGLNKLTIYAVKKQAGDLLFLEDINSGGSYRNHIFDMKNLEFVAKQVVTTFLRDDGKELIFSTRTKDSVNITLYSSSAQDTSIHGLVTGQLIHPDTDNLHFRIGGIYDSSIAIKGRIVYSVAIDNYLTLKNDTGYHIFDINSGRCVVSGEEREPMFVGCHDLKNIDRSIALIRLQREELPENENCPREIYIDPRNPENSMTVDIDGQKADRGTEQFFTVDGKILVAAQFEVERKLLKGTKIISGFYDIENQRLLRSHPTTISSINNIRYKNGISYDLRRLGIKTTHNIPLDEIRGNADEAL